MKKVFSYLIIVLIICMSSVHAFAQCAMCKAGVESDLNNNGSIANGLNTGILFLMAIPYIIIMIGGYFFFKKPIDAKIKAWRDKHFPAKTQ